MDAGGRTTPGAVIELTRLPLKKWIREWRIESREKTITRDALNLIPAFVHALIKP